MAQVKLRNMPALTGVLGTDLAYVGSDPSGTPVSRKVKYGDVFQSLANVRPSSYYGLVGNDSFDNALKFQDAFQDLVDEGGGTLLMGPGVFACSTVQGSNAQVNFPDVGDGGINTTDSEQISLRIVGALPGPTSGASTALPESGHTVFKSTVTSGAHTSVFASSRVGLRNNLHVEILNIVGQAPPDPAYHFWDLRYQQDVVLKHLLVHAGEVNFQDIVEPTHSVSAIFLPQANFSGSGQCVQHTTVWGFPVGYTLGEMLMGGINMAAWGCLEAVDVSDSYHYNYIHSLVVGECPKAIVNAASGGPALLSIGFLDIERNNNYGDAWMNSVIDIEDSGSNIRGRIHEYHILDAAVGVPTPITKNGGTKLHCTAAGFVPSVLSVPATEATAGAVTFTAAQVVGGLILRDPNGANRADLLPTATNLLAVMDRQIGAHIEFDIRNTADAAETITVTTNTGLTLSGTMTIAQSNSRRFRAVATNVATPAVTVYSLGTVVF